MAFDLGSIGMALTLHIEDFASNLKIAEQSVKDVDDKFSGFGDMGGRLQSMGSALTLGLTVPLVGAGVAAVHVGDDFEAAMSRVKAISGSTGQDFTNLKDLALQLGADTAFSSSQAAAGMENLASAGFDANEIMKAMPGMLDLAAASGGDVANAADIASSALRGFGLQASDAGHVADVLAKAAASTNAEIGDTGEAMKYIAPVAHGMGLSMEEVTAAIGEMSNAGIKGSQAGTTLRSALTRLADPSKESASLMKELGFNAFDSQGKMLPLKDMVGNLQKSMAGLTDQQKQQALSTIFGQEAMSGMLVLTDQGPDSLDSLTKSLQSSDGAAKDMATTMQDNAKGSIEQMKGSLETAGIKIQEIVAPAIKDLADKVTDLANWFSGLDDGTKKIIMSIGGVAAVVGPMIIGFGSAMKAVKEFQEGMAIARGVIDAVKNSTLLKAAADQIAAGAQWALNAAMDASPIMWVILAIMAVVAAIVYFYNNNEWFRDKVNAIWEKVKEMFGKFWDFLSKLFKTVKDAVVDFAGPFIENAKYIITHWSEVKDKLKEYLGAIWDGIKDKLGAAVDFLKDTFNGAVDGVKKIWGGLSDFFSGLFQFLYFHFTNGLQIIIDFVNDNFGGLKDSITQIFDGIKEVISGAWELIKTIVLGAILLICDLVSGDFGKLKEDAGKIWDSIKQAISTVWDGIWKVISGYLETIWIYISGVWKIITDAVKAVWDGIKKFLSDTWESIKKACTDAFNAVRDGIKNTWDTIVKNVTNFVTSIYNGIVNGWANMKKSVSDGMSNIYKTIVDWFNSAVTWIKGLPGTLYTQGTNMISSLKNGISSVIGGVYNTISDGISNAVSYITGLPGKFYSWGSDMVQGMINGIRDMIGSVEDAASALAAKIRAFLHFSVPDEGPLTDYESWMPDFMGGLASGIKDKSYLVTDQLKGLASGMKSSIAIEPEVNIPTDLGTGGKLALAGADGSGAGQTIINFNGNYSFANNDQVDYFMNQAALMADRRKK